MTEDKSECIYAYWKYPVLCPDCLKKALLFNVPEGRDIENMKWLILNSRLWEGNDNARGMYAPYIAEVFEKKHTLPCYLCGKVRPTKRDI